MPPWAEALILRIDNIEKNGVATSPRKSQEGSVSVQLSLNEFASDERYALFFVCTDYSFDCSDEAFAYDLRGDRDQLGM